jgi:hypothetical protein
MRQLTRYNERIDARPAELYHSGRLWMQPFLLMPKNRMPSLESEPSREPFITIDDLSHLAQALVAGLNRLGSYKYPLAVRRGKGVIKVAAQDNSQTVKAGAKTYFFDIKETREGKRYLIITESRFKGEGSERERASIIVFPEHVKEFADTVSQMANKL